MAILSSIVLSQQCSGVYIISSYSNEGVTKLMTRPCLQSAKLRGTTRQFAQWNLILAHLQFSTTLEKHENKGKLFELNMYFVRILIRFYAYSNNAQSFYSN